MFLVICLILPSGLGATSICYGDVVRVKHLASKKNLRSIEKAFKDGQMDGIAEMDRRHKEVIAQKEADFESLWIIKGEHSEDLRWNCQLGAPVETGQKIRLESVATHCNLTLLSNSKEVVAVKRVSRPMGISAVEDELRLEFCLTSGELDVAKAKGELDSAQQLRLFFAEVENKQLILWLSDKNTLMAQEEKDFSGDALKQAVWTLELLQPGFAQKENAALDSAVKELRARSEFLETSSTTVSTVSIWQSEDAGKFLIGATEGADFFAYLSARSDGSGINEKLDRRFAWVDVQDAASLWGCDKERKISKGKLQDHIVTEWTEVAGAAELVLAGRDKEAYRLSSTGWGLFKTEQVEPQITWQAKPFLNEVTSAAVGTDGTLWWIDLSGKVQKKLDDKTATIFEHVSLFHPKFVKISAAGSWAKNYVALLRSDGQIFVAHDDGAFFNPGVNQILDVSIGVAGKIAIAVRRLQWPHGPIFKTEFKELERLNKDNKKLYDATFDDAEDLINYYQYNFELVKRSVDALSKFIVAFEAAADRLSVQVKKSSAAQDFFAEKLVPAVKDEELDREATQAMAKMKTELFSDDSSKDLVQKITTAQAEQAKIEAVAKQVQENKLLENKLALMQQEVETSYAKIDALQEENQALKAEALPLEPGTAEKPKDTPEQRVLEVPPSGSTLLSEL
jgi:hypothetical protein